MKLLGNMSLPGPSRLNTPLQPTCNINKPLPPRPLRRVSHGIQSMGPQCLDMGYGVASSSRQTPPPPPPPRQLSYDEHDPLASGAWFGGTDTPKSKDNRTSHIFDTPPSSLTRMSASPSVFAIARRNAAQRISDEERRRHRLSLPQPSPPSSPALTQRDLTYRRRSEADGEPLLLTPPASPRLTSKRLNSDVCDPEVWLKSVQLQMHSDYDPSSGRYLQRGLVRSARCYGDAGGLRESPALQRVTSQRAVVSSGARQRRRVRDAMDI